MLTYPSLKTLTLMLTYPSLKTLMLMVIKTKEIILMFIMRLIKHTLIKPKCPPWIITLTNLKYDSTPFRRVSNVE